MREFQAWHIKEKYMFNVSELAFLEGGIYVYGPGVGEGWSEVNEKFKNENEVTIILRESIGLRDKNGKEIYEGDIVGVDRWDSFSSYNKAIIVYADNHGSFLLSYTKPLNPNGFLAKESITSNDKTVLFDRCTGWELEIIGNAYENPDLLT